MMKIKHAKYFLTNNWSKSKLRVDFGTAWKILTYATFHQEVIAPKIEIGKNLTAKNSSTYSSDWIARTHVNSSKVYYY